MKPPAYWARARRELAARDPVMRTLIAAGTPLVAGSRGDAFSTLARAIVGQQISVKAAQAVWTRVGDALGAIAPARLLACDAARLKACGLSGRKTDYLRDLAARFASGELDPEQWPALEDEALIARLTGVKGIGRWTAQMYMIFHLARPDVYPTADAGLQRALTLHYNRNRPLTEDAIARLGQRWSPWRSVATWYLWRSLDNPDDA